VCFQPFEFLEPYALGREMYGNAVCLAKDQVTREARTRTTKRYVTLDSLFFSYILEIEEAFHS
jgi:hypothetical protein